MLVYIIFTNDNGRYYLEEVSSLDIEQIRKDWNVGKEMNNKDWKIVKEELNNPTTEDEEQLVVLEYCYE